MKAVIIALMLSVPLVTTVEAVRDQKQLEVRSDESHLGPNLPVVLGLVETLSGCSNRTKDAEIAYKAGITYLISAHLTEKERARGAEYLKDRTDAIVNGEVADKQNSALAAQHFQNDEDRKLRLLIAEYARTGANGFALAALAANEKVEVEKKIYNGCSNHLKNNISYFKSSTCMEESCKTSKDACQEDQEIKLQHMLKLKGEYEIGADSDQTQSWQWSLEELEATYTKIESVGACAGDFYSKTDFARAYCGSYVKAARKNLMVCGEPNTGKVSAALGKIIDRLLPLLLQSARAEAETLEVVTKELSDMLPSLMSSDFFRKQLYSSTRRTKFFGFLSDSLEAEATLQSRGADTAKKNLDGLGRIRDQIKERGKVDILDSLPEYKEQVEYTSLCPASRSLCPRNNQTIVPEFGRLRNKIPSKMVKSLSELTAKIQKSTSPYDPVARLKARQFNAEEVSLRAELKKSYKKTFGVKPKNGDILKEFEQLLGQKPKAGKEIKAEVSAKPEEISATLAPEEVAAQEEVVPAEPEYIQDEFTKLETIRSEPEYGARNLASEESPRTSRYDRNPQIGSYQGHKRASEAVKQQEINPKRNGSIFEQISQRYRKNFPNPR